MEHEDFEDVLCSLCRSFYNLHNDWVSGTGGGISIRDRDQDVVYLAPSGVQKERMQPADLFVMKLSTGEYLRKPDNYKPSSCTPLFLAQYLLHDCGACIHTHSQAAVLISMIYKDEFAIRNIEQIKAMPSPNGGHLQNTDFLRIPIINNMHHENELEPAMRQVLQKYPHTVAVIVRGHGIFIWGKTIWEAKVYTESIEYILELALKMKELGLGYGPFLRNYD